MEMNHHMNHVNHVNQIKPQYSVCCAAVMAQREKNNCEREHKHRMQHHICLITTLRGICASLWMCACARVCVCVL